MSFSTDLTNSSSGWIQLDVPTYSGSSTSVTGILVDDVTINFANNWAPLKEFDELTDTLQEAQQVLQCDSISSWVAGSSQAYKGAQPIQVQADFYLISMNKDSNIGAKARALADLAALSVTGGTSVQFHGGYTYDVLTNNNNLKTEDFLSSGVQKASGTITMYLPGSLKVTGLLLQGLTVKPSTVTVKKGTPLYYYISLTMKTYRAPITSDLGSAFGIQ